MPEFVHENFSAGVLITNGMGADALSGALITAAKFHLFECDATITIPRKRIGGGGSIPMAPGEIQNMYQPVDQSLQPPYYIPTNNDPLANLKNLVIVKININGNVSEKEFMMKPKPYKALINIINVYNATDFNIRTHVKNLTLKANSIFVKLKKLRKS